MRMEKREEKKIHRVIVFARITRTYTYIYDFKWNVESNMKLYNLYSIR